MESTVTAGAEGLWGHRDFWKKSSGEKAPNPGWPLSVESQAGHNCCGLWAVWGWKGKIRGQVLGCATSVMLFRVPVPGQPLQQLWCGSKQGDFRCPNRIEGNVWRDWEPGKVQNLGFSWWDRELSQVYTVLPFSSGQLWTSATMCIFPHCLEWWFRSVFTFRTSKEMKMEKVLQRSIRLCSSFRYLYNPSKYCVMKIIVFLKLLKFNYHLLGNHIEMYQYTLRGHHLWTAVPCCSVSGLLLSPPAQHSNCSFLSLKGPIVSHSEGNWPRLQSWIQF